MMYSLISQHLAGEFASKRWERSFMGLLTLTVVLTVCGYFVLALDWLPQDFGWFGSTILFLSLMVVAVSERRMKSTRYVALETLLIVVGALGLEFAGVQTGFPFGNYSYTNVLGFHVAGVPAAIGAAWYVTIICTRRICQAISSHPLRTALLAALLTLALDVALEPMAGPVTRYWQWHAGQVPMQNYSAWFLISFAAVAVLESLEKSDYRAPSQRVRSTAIFVFLLHLGLFITVDIVNGFFGEVVVSGAIVTTILVILRRQNRILVLRSADAV